VIRNYEEGGRSIAEIEDTLGRKERIIFEFPDENKMRVIKENAKGHKVEELYQMFSDGKKSISYL
jgi:predicted transcriptional regulator